jgi:hypothetical protein
VHPEWVSDGIVVAQMEKLTITALAHERGLPNSTLFLLGRSFPAPARFVHLLIVVEAAEQGQGWEWAHEIAPAVGLAC